MSSSARPTSDGVQYLQDPNSKPNAGTLRYPSNKRTIYDRHLNRTRTAETSQASFAYLFNEMILYAQRKVTDITDFEKRLNNQGQPLGHKLLDLLLYRSPIPFHSTDPRSHTLRPISILPLLQFISVTLWKHLFGKPADELQRSQDNEDEYMITDNDPMVNKYISVPKEMNQLNCAAYVAGIIEGVCDGAEFFAKVTAHSVGDEEEEDGTVAKTAPMWPDKTIFLVKFNPEVMEREAILAKSRAKT